MMSPARGLLLLIPLATLIACSNDPVEPDPIVQDPIVPDSIVSDPTFAEIIRADEPVVFWRFEEDAGALTAADSSGNGHTAAYLGGAVQGMPLMGTATGNGVRLSTVTDGVRSNSNSWSEMAEFSVEAWVKPEGGVGEVEMIIVDKAETWNLYVDWDGRPGIQFPGGLHTATAPGPLVIGEIYHLAGTQADGTFSMYVNGVLVREFTSGRLIDMRDNPIFVGRGLTAGFHDFIGVIDEVAIYDKVLTAADILRHYNAGRQD